MSWPGAGPRLALGWLLPALGCLLLVIGCQTPGGEDAEGSTAAAQAAPAPRDWSAPVDFSALRGEYGNRDDFDALCVDERPFVALAEQAPAKDWTGIIATSAPWLDSCPIDMDVHFVRAVALKEVGRTEESELHVAWYKGLVGSVLSSGDGRSPQSAWVVISVQEEYAILRGLRARAVSQELVEGRIDKLDIERSNGQRATIYFDPKAHFQRLVKQREEAAAEGAAGQ